MSAKPKPMASGSEGLKYMVLHMSRHQRAKESGLLCLQPLLRTLIALASHSMQSVSHTCFDLLPGLPDKLLACPLSLLRRICRPIPRSLPPFHPPTLPYCHSLTMPRITTPQEFHKHVLSWSPCSPMSVPDPASGPVTAAPISYPVRSLPDRGAPPPLQSPLCPPPGMLTRRTVVAYHG